MDRMPPADPSMFGEPPMFVPGAGPSGAGEVGVELVASDYPKARKMIWRYLRDFS